MLIAEVKFGEWTKDGILRAPVFLRLREDKNAEECIIEADNATKDRSELDNEVETRKNTNARKQGIDRYWYRQGEGYKPSQDLLEGDERSSANFKKRFNRIL